MYPLLCCQIQEDTDASKTPELNAERNGCTKHMVSLLLFPALPLIHPPCLSSGPFSSGSPLSLLGQVLSILPEPRSEGLPSHLLQPSHTAWEACVGSAPLSAMEILTSMSLATITGSLQTPGLQCDCSMFQENKDMHLKIQFLGPSAVA